jgi:predicted outer membrane protein
MRWLTGILSAVVAGLVATSGTAMAHPGDDGVPDAPDVPGTTVSDTDPGPVTAADRDFVIKVRLAGLWEMPAGQMAMQKGVNQRVQDIGKMISDQHGKLDELARTAAAKLKITLPDEPNADQKTWLGEMRDATGAEFDQVFVDRLRAAHGKIFPVIGTIRSGTRNDVVRQLAQQTNQFVLTHLTLLESTGLVDYGSLPKPPDPGAAANAANAAAVSDAGVLAAAGVRQPGGSGSPVIWIVLVSALIAGGFSTVRLLRPR